MKILIATVLVLAASFAPRSEAQARPLPWCVASGDSNVYNCSYYTFEQCRRAAMGDGTCERNPYFEYSYRQRGRVAPQDVDPRRYPTRRECWGPFCW